MPAKRRPVPLGSLAASWELSLQEANKSPKTIISYVGTLSRLVTYLEDHQMLDGTETVSKTEIRSFLIAEAARTSVVSASLHHRNLRVFFGWLEREGERVTANPMLAVEAPKVSRTIKPVLKRDQLAALIRSCEGASFESRRDLAILRVLMDTGVRVSGLAGMRVGDVHLPGKTITVTLKGGDELLIPLGKKAAAAMDRYLRARARHSRASSPWLWLGMRGHNADHFGVSGIGDMLDRRGEQAGITGLTPHWFRRTFARDWLDVGGSEHALMRITGWKTRSMIDVYAGDLAAERAREAHKLLSPGDRI